ncbi:MAG: ribonuclease H-like domain-containing protein [Anaerolineales bacterium]
MTVFFDVETQNTLQEVGGHYPERLKVSVAVTYNTDDAAYHHYTEAKMPALVEELRTTDLIVGYNLYGFDYPVVQQYTSEVQLATLPTVDMMAVLEKQLGHRIGLDAVATATLGINKSADGLQAVRWWRQGRLQEIIAYCQQDVEVTRRVYEFGKLNRYVQFYDKSYRLRKVPVAW